MVIAVIDGQGGGIGVKIIQEIRKNLDLNLEILAIGTNSIATSSMLKVGANHGATGENPVVFNSPRVDVILGPIAIVLANGLKGEITPRMAESISSSPAKKILLPSGRCNVEVVTSSDDSLSTQVDILIKKLKKIISN
ncbi:DUF3842 family protein [Sporosalibacterium faouarense]|uniref:DUF3842 family protein n=1 Tax=Sporosalibacterium faouarense TaxID=516123 RepID=UPI00141C7F23|nr:DUF3842 family protein [Sporosalibacterium faouarense]MTI48893.1 DUF3842 family protein [Bacillota bacterium]